MFESSYDPATGVVTLKTSGFYSLDRVGAMEEQTRALMNRAWREQGRSRILVMGDGLLVQGSDVIDHCTSAMVRFRATKPGDSRTALVLSSALVRLQLAKLFQGENVRIFSTVEEANAWLLGAASGSSAAA